MMVWEKIFATQIIGKSLRAITSKKKKKSTYKSIRKNIINLVLKTGKINIPFVNREVST